MCPSGQSAAVALLLALAADGGEARDAQAARRALALLAARIDAAPAAWGALLASLSRPSLVAVLRRATEGSAQIASALPDSADHVHAQARWTAADHTTLAVDIRIDPGYHVNANPASDPDLIPTTLAIEGRPDLKVDYPPGQDFKAPFAPRGLSVYTGRVTLSAHLPREAAPAQAKLRVQACNDRYCLAPATIEVPLAATANR